MTGRVTGGGYYGCRCGGVRRGVKGGAQGRGEGETVWGRPVGKE